MRTEALAAMMMMTAASTAAYAGLPAARPVIVCAQMEAGSEAEYAQTLAVSMFHHIGVRLEWHGTHHCPADALQLTLSYSAPADLKPGALAYAQPYEGTHIVVMMDRVERIVAVPGRVLMAHVFVHEICHILQGMARHSEQGVMKARWDSNDYRTMRMAPMSFTPADVALIHAGLAAREQLLARAAEMKQDRTMAVADSRR